LDIGTIYPVGKGGTTSEGIFYQVDADASGFAQFRLHSADLENAVISVTTTLLFGLVDIYITSDGSPPSLTNHQWSSKQASVRDIILMKSEEIGSIAEEGKLFNILISSTAKSKGRILVAKPVSVVALTAGVPQLGWINTYSQSDGNESFSLFKFDMSQLENTGSVPVTLSITQLAGDVASLTVQVNGNSWLAHPDTEGESFIQMSLNDSALLSASLDIRVSSGNSSMFAVLATVATQQYPTWLLGGLPLVDNAPSHQDRFYVMEVPAKDIEFTVALEPLHGSPDLSVAASSFVSPTTDAASVPVDAILATGTNGFQLVNAAAGDKLFKTGGGTYFITVNAAFTSLYSALLTAPSSVTELRENRAVHVKLRQSTYGYFQFHDITPTPDQSMFFLMTAISGDADLYIGCTIDNTGTPLGYPSEISGHHNFSTYYSFEDSITIHPSDKHSCSHPSKPAVVFAAVLGEDTSEFTIIAAREGEVITLHPGVPQTSALPFFGGSSFRFRTGSVSSEVTITLTPEYGDPDVFVAINGEPASLSNYQYESMSPGQDPDEVLISADDICLNCWISIYVETVFGSSRFSIVVQSQSRGTVLKNAWPHQCSIGRDQYKYYSITAATDGTLVITMTILSGEAELFASDTENLPVKETVGVMHSTAASGTPPQIVFHIQSQQEVYIGVHGLEDNTMLTVQTRVEPLAGPPVLNSLVDGLPQGDIIREHSTHYYQLVTSAGHGTLNIIASLSIGSISLFVNRCTQEPFECNKPEYLPTSDTATWSSIGWTREESLVIDRVDEDKVSYVIAVQANSDSDFTITATLQGSILRLIPGKALRDSVPKGSSSFYKVELPNFNATLTISLTTISGDPDLYVSDYFTHPGPQNYTWANKKAGDDTLTIYSDQVQMKNSFLLLYIGVYGYRDSIFSILVKYSTLNSALLLSGQPQTDVVAKGEASNYVLKFPASPNADFTITVTPSYGDPDLFVTLDGSDPTFENCQYCSENMHLAETVLIHHTDEAFVAANCSTEPCKMKIAVFGYDTSEYTLLVKEAQSPSTLQEDVPFLTTLPQNVTEFFVFTWQEPDVQLQITTFSGHTQLRVSCGQTFPGIVDLESLDIPNAGEPSTMHIHASDASSQGCPPPPSNLFISVLGKSWSRVSLIASQCNNQGFDCLQRLQFGLQQTGTVQHQSFNFYKIRTTSPDQNIEILSNTIVGQIRLYVARIEGPRPRLLPNGTVINYELKSASFADKYITIPRGGTDLCSSIEQGCFFLVAVFGQQNSASEVLSEYTLLVTTVTAQVLLQDGVPVRGHASRGKYAFYEFINSIPGADLTLSVTPFSGDPDLFMSLSPHQPNRTSFTWTSAWYGAETLTLQAEELDTACLPDPGNKKACSYFLSVYGFSNTTFTVLAALHLGWAHPVSLILGQPQTASLPEKDWVYYQLRLSLDGEDQPTVLISVTSLDGGDQDVYLSFSRQIEPGPANAAIIADSTQITEVVRLSPGMPDYCLSCNIYIGVFGFRGGNFTIVASAGIQKLQAGHPQEANVRDRDERFYAFFNDGFNSITFDVTPITGDPDLFIGTEYTLPEGEMPSSHLHTWAAFRQGRDSITIHPDDNHYCSYCTYLVGIYGYANCTFTIGATLGQEQDTVRLTHNRPQSGTLPQGGIKYYFLSLGNVEEDLRVVLTPLTGSADMYAAEGDRTRHPDPSDSNSYNYTSEGAFANQLVIPGPHTDLASYVIAVSALQDTDYILVATFVEHPQLLQLGVPVRGEVAPKGNAYYEFLLDQDADIEISCVAISGDPDVMVSSAGISNCEVPESDPESTICSNFTWGSFVYSTDTLRINHDDPCFPTSFNTRIEDCEPSMFRQGSFYVSIFSQTGATFTLSASISGTVTNLVDGVPQHGITSLQTLCYLIDDLTGSCLDLEPTPAQAAFFKFKVSQHDLNSNGNVAITLVPDCKAPGNKDTSTFIMEGPGCSALDPLSLVMRSCQANTCTLSDQQPIEEYGRFHAKRSVDSNHGTLFIADDPLDRYNGFCNPALTQSTCFYYISVLHYNISRSAAFTLTVATPDNILVIPCPVPWPVDGMLITPLVVLANGQKSYEACAKEGRAMSFSLETCSGDLTLSICDEDCTGVYPTPDDYYFKSNFTHICSMTKSGDLHTQEECKPNLKGFPGIAIDTARDKTFFVVVSGSGTYKLKIHTSGEHDERLPFLATYADKKVTISQLTDDAIQVTWPSARAVWKEARHVEPNGLFYTVYVYELQEAALNKECWKSKCGENDLVGSTACGLQQFSTNHPEKSRTFHISPYGEMDDQSLLISGLTPGTLHGINVIALCNSDCMRGIPDSLCYGQQCQDTTLTYDIIYAKTVSRINPKHYWFWLKMGSAALGGAALFVLVAFQMYRWKRIQRTKEQFIIRSGDGRMIHSEVPQRYRRVGQDNVEDGVNESARPLMEADDHLSDDEV